MKLSLIFPLWKETESPQEKLRDVVSFWRRFPMDVEIVFIIDPVRGESVEMWQKWIQELEPPKSIEFSVHLNPKRLGRGASVAKGLDLAQGEVLAVNSFDLSIPLGDMFSAVQEFVMHRAQDFLLVGNRRSKKKQRRGAQKRLRKIYEDIEHEKSMSLQLPDPTCPFFMLKKTSWERLKPIHLRRWFYTPGLILAARQQGLEVRSLDVQCLDHRSSRMGVLDFIR